ncbi:MAG: DUF2793 domain-containing protein, partial [Pseudomonadota bacterium]
MNETYHLSLPLVAAAQAQKHVTVNEALARLDTLAQLRVVSAAVTSPPAGPIDGESYIVPAGAGGDWSGQAPKIAVFANGAWEFITPKAGWRAWNEASAPEAPPLPGTPQARPLNCTSDALASFQARQPA